MKFSASKHPYSIKVRDLHRLRSTLQSESANTVKLGSLHDAMNLSRESIHRVFVIGGASVYTEALELRNEAGFWVDRILLTHIISPSFEDCNVFFPDVWKPESSLSKWRRSNHQELEKWLGVEVSAGVQEEKGVEYEYQMWVRESNPAADVGVSTHI
jgi:dihydrofolate reductase